MAEAIESANDIEVAKLKARIKDLEDENERANDLLKRWMAQPETEKRVKELETALTPIVNTLNELSNLDEGSIPYGKNTTHVGVMLDYLRDARSALNKPYAF